MSEGIAEMKDQIIELKRALSVEVRHADRKQAEFGKTLESVAALEQHVSDLEKSLEDARKWRDEAVSHLADVTEVLVGERPVGIMPGTTLEAAMVLVRDRDAALADNAVFQDGFLRVMNLLENIGRQEDAETVRTVAMRSHPGAALLDEVTRLRVQVATGGGGSGLRCSARSAFQTTG